MNHSGCWNTRLVVGRPGKRDLQEQAGGNEE